MKYLSIIFVLFLASFNFLFAQRGMTASVTLNSVTHADCYGNKGSMNLQLTVTNPLTPYVIGGYSITVIKNGSYLTTLSSSQLQGSASIALNIPNYDAGQYRLYGSITATNPSTLGVYGSASFNSLDVFIGTKAFWENNFEMSVQSNSSIVLQNVTTPSQTYAAARASNFENYDGYHLIKPIFNTGNSTNRIIYVSLQGTGNLTSFNTASYNYLYFDNNATTGGVFYKSTTGIYKLTGVVYTDEIRILRSAGTFYFYKGQSTAQLSAVLQSNGSTMAPFSVSTINFNPVPTVYTKVIQDGIELNSSYYCNSNASVYAELKDELDGDYFTMKNGKLMFRFYNEYDSQTALNYTIYNSYGLLVKLSTTIPAIPVVHGDNYITVDLTTSQGCIGPGIFYVVVTNDKKQKKYLRFYSDYNSCTPIPDLPTE